MEELAQENKFFRDRLSVLEPLITLKQRQIDAILEVTRAINQNIPMEALVRILEAVIYAQLGITKWSLIIKNNKREWECISYQGDKERIKSTEEISRLIDPFLKCTQITEVKEHDEFTHLIPVINHQEIIAFAFLGGFPITDNTDFNDRLKFVQTITNMICVANENKRLQEQEIEQKILKRDIALASVIQSVLVPKKFPKSDQFDIAALYKPFREIGGDYYDFFPISDTEYFFCMCDISGKGVAAAMIMSNFQANLRLTVKKNISLPLLIAELNEIVYNLTKGDAFITGFFGKYNTTTKSIKYINAGHNPPVLKQGDVITELTIGCSILGAIKKLPAIIADTVYLKPKAFLITYTDGLTEASDAFGNLFGSEELKLFTAKSDTSNAELFILKLIQEIQNFSSKDMFDDDISLMCIHFS
jgi:phosphoserine phosphatase RsbU/P